MRAGIGIVVVLLATVASPAAQADTALRGELEAMKPGLRLERMQRALAEGGAGAITPMLGHAELGKVVLWAFQSASEEALRSLLGDVAAQRTPAADLQAVFEHLQRHKDAQWARLALLGLGSSEPGWADAARQALSASGGPWRGRLLALAPAPGAAFEALSSQERIGALEELIAQEEAEEFAPRLLASTAAEVSKDGLLAAVAAQKPESVARWFEIASGPCRRAFEQGITTCLDARQVSWAALLLGAAADCLEDAALAAVLDLVRTERREQVLACLSRVSSRPERLVRLLPETAVTTILQAAELDRLAQEIAAISRSGSAERERVDRLLLAMDRLSSLLPFQQGQLQRRLEAVLAQQAGLQPDPQALQALPDGVAFRPSIELSRGEGHALAHLLEKWTQAQDQGLSCTGLAMVCAGWASVRPLACIAERPACASGNGPQ